ncbi:hypothetical protein [Microbacterium testaceum]|uniref:hypothetical protein n=1 Tax=Microbacterium testaceum TaxID=2033 RepID=UPI0022E15754|nr:hypothetical protein [Microbacterium testaceum]
MSAAREIAERLARGDWAAGLPQTEPRFSAYPSLPIIPPLAWAYTNALRQWLDQLEGQPALVAGYARGWEAASRQIALLPDLISQARTSAEELDGRTARAIRARYDDLQQISCDAMEWTGATGAALQLALRVVEATRTLFYDALEELIELAKQLILSPSNPFEIADQVAGFAHAAADLTGAAGRLVMALLEAMHALRTLMAQLVPIIARGVDAIREVVAQMLPGAGALVMTALGGPLMGGAGTLLGGAGENLLQRSAEVEELDPSSLEGKQRDAWDRAQTVTAISSLSDLVSVNGTTDLIGGADSTVIDIKKIIGPDGAERWVVALPSTQDWQFFSDAGALNDRDSNIALMLNDAAFRSVYERAVREAMRVAGIPQGADVILTGFSQGGILAAKLASDDTFPYNTVGVVTNGSSVDSFSVPPVIPVLRFPAQDRRGAYVGWEPLRTDSAQRPKNFAGRALEPPVRARQRRLRGVNPRVGGARHGGSHGAACKHRHFHRSGRRAFAFPRLGIELEDPLIKAPASLTPNRGEKTTGAWAGVSLTGLSETLPIGGRVQVSQDDSLEASPAFVVMSWASCCAIVLRACGNWTWRSATRKTSRSAVPPRLPSSAPIPVTTG